MTVPVERASPQPPLLLRKAGVAAPKVPCRPRTRSGVPARSEPPPRRGCSPPVPRGSEPGGFVTKLLSPARKPHGKPGSSLWGHRAPRFPPTKAGMPVPGGAHRGTVAFSLVCSDPSPRERRRCRSPGAGGARRLLRPPRAALPAPPALGCPFLPPGTIPEAHLDLPASQQPVSALPGPAPPACGLGSRARGAPNDCASRSEPAGDPGVSRRAQENALSTSGHARSAGVQSQAAWPRGGPDSPPSRSCDGSGTGSCTRSAGLLLPSCTAAALPSSSMRSAWHAPRGRRRDQDDQ